MQDLLAEKRIIFGEDESQIIQIKEYLEEYEGKLSSVLVQDSRTGANEMVELFGEQKVFSTPKPASLLKEIFQFVTVGDDLIFDFFAGSGATAQAVLELNEEGGNRKFILVQLPEPTGRKDFPTIAEITKERVRRVIRRLNEKDAGELALASSADRRDRGFKVFKLAASNFAVWDPALAARDAKALAKQWELSADNVRADAQEQALLYELLLKCGLPLSTPIGTADAAGTPVYLVDEGRLLICLARALTRGVLRAMIDLKPQSVLCLDVGFKGNDALKVNAQLEFQARDIQFRTA